MNTRVQHVSLGARAKFHQLLLRSLSWYTVIPTIKGEIFSFDLGAEQSSMTRLYDLISTNKSKCAFIQETTVSDPLFHTAILGSLGNRNIAKWVNSLH